MGSLGSTAGPDPPFLNHHDARAPPAQAARGRTRVRVEGGPVPLEPGSGGAGGLC